MSSEDPFPSSASSAFSDRTSSESSLQDAVPKTDPTPTPPLQSESDLSASEPIEPDESAQVQSPSESVVSEAPKSDESSTPKRPKVSKSTSSKSKSSSPSETEKYALNVLHEDILETPKALNQEHDVSALSEEDLRLYKVVQHLIDEGFIDDLEFFNLIVTFLIIFHCVSICFHSMKFPNLSVEH